MEAEAARVTRVALYERPRPIVAVRATVKAAYAPTTRGREKMRVSLTLLAHDIVGLGIAHPDGEEHEEQEINDSLHISI